MAWPPGWPREQRTITATDPSTQIAGTGLLTVIPAVLLSISVAPVADSIGVGQTEQYTATGLYSDLSTADLTSSVTWSSTNATAASVSSGGLATGLATGITEITATDPSTQIAGTGLLTVTSGTPAPTLSMTPSTGRRHSSSDFHGIGVHIGTDGDGDVHVGTKEAEESQHRPLFVTSSLRWVILLQRHNSEKTPIRTSGSEVDCRLRT